MNPNKLIIAGIVLILLVGAAMTLETSRSPSETTRITQAETGDEPEASPVRTGLAQSSDKVNLMVTGAARSDAGTSSEIAVTLNIEPGWHVNANPASMEFLIPTTTSAVANGKPLDVQIQYPRGRVSDITLGETAIEVYDDGASIRLQPGEENFAILEEAGELDLKVRVQACSDSGVCLAPSDLTVTLAADEIRQR